MSTSWLLILIVGVALMPVAFAMPLTMSRYLPPWMQSLTLVPATRRHVPARSSSSSVGKRPGHLVGLIGVQRANGTSGTRLWWVTCRIRRHSRRHCRRVTSRLRCGTMPGEPPCNSRPATAPLSMSCLTVGPKFLSNAPQAGQRKSSDIDSTTFGLPAAFLTSLSGTATVMGITVPAGGPVTDGFVGLGLPRFEDQKHQADGEEDDDRGQSHLDQQVASTVGRVEVVALLFVRHGVRLPADQLHA